MALEWIDTEAIEFIKNYLANEGVAYKEGEIRAVLDAHRVVQMNYEKGDYIEYKEEVDAVYSTLQNEIEQLNWVKVSELYNVNKDEITNLDKDDVHNVLLGDYHYCISKGIIIPDLPGIDNN